jgi:hypothetical protein
MSSTELRTVFVKNQNCQNYTTKKTSSTEKQRWRATGQISKFKTLPTLELFLCALIGH